MGIKQLYNIIKKYAPESTTERHISFYKYRRFAIDSSILLYKFKYNPQAMEKSHIFGFINKTLFFLRNHIQPIFVFDGIPPEEKRNTIIKRLNKRKKQKLVSKQDHEESKEILRLLGMPVIEADGEAEAVCAELCKKNYADYTFTEDSDSLTFGTPYVLKFSQKRNYLIEFDLKKLHSLLELNHNEFVDLCILCGCDYTSSIIKLGPIKSYHYIQNYRCIENVINHLDLKQYTIPQNFEYKKARYLFLKEYDIYKQYIIWKPMNLRKIYYNLKYHGIDNTYITNYIKKINNIIYWYYNPYICNLEFEKYNRFTYQSIYPPTMINTTSIIPQHYEWRTNMIYTK